MSEHAMGMIVGVLTGLAVGLVVMLAVLKATKTDKSIRCRYDERQQTARGEAYRYGFWTAVMGMLVYALVLAAAELPVEPELGITLIAFLAITVQACCSIRRGAYFSMNESRKRVQIVLCCVGLINILAGAVNILNGIGYRHGKLGLGSLNLFAGLMVLVTLWASAFLPREREDSEDEE